MRVNPKVNSLATNYPHFLYGFRYFLKNGCEYVIVKTISNTDPDVNYTKTRAFYKKIGFKELVALTEMMDKNNPCLIMIKYLR